MTFRAFISVDLDREERIADYIAELKNADPTLKVVDPGQIHITLKFLGDTDEAKVPPISEAMRAAAEGVPPFDLKLAGSSAFPSKNKIRVIWIGMNDALPLGTMAGRLDEGLAALGIARENRPFAPHVTVARTKVDAPNPAVRQVIDNHAHADFGTHRIDRLLLKKSVLTKCGPQYSTVEEIRLAQ